MESVVVQFEVPMLALLTFLILVYLILGIGFVSVLSFRGFFAENKGELEMRVFQTFIIIVWILVFAIMVTGYMLLGIINTLTFIPRSFERKKES